ncbi:MAG: hypothetical protein COV52_07815 [Gammaproteobacteria bacterium CG11_big_fil_rev_8_21_14_0_20_46_22]|nr:MAG: hypothetical protein COW05_03895 [Gammaproteobacteria bacterium CG12_big_fil_rev_8_21_14_0_65_46_12]PIR10663.1 MAG: hypothetical protein COV52_07815 [Gammaproteobacteria bacterium CG11_big_fil_rev_8_21_14_0_20_46_22]
MAFNDLIDTISKAWNYLAHPYHLYDISLERVIYDTQKSEEVAHFVIKNFRTLRKLPVRKALKDRQLAAKLSPLELTLLTIIAEEERLHHGLSLSANVNTVLERFLAYPLVESYFFSAAQKRHMLVIHFEDSDHETCLSVRELADMPDYIEALRKSEEAYHAANTSEDSEEAFA